MDDYVKLRKTVADPSTHMGDYLAAASPANIARLLAERDALREALREIMDAYDWPFPPEKDGHLTQVAWAERRALARKAARAALKDQP